MAVYVVGDLHLSFSNPKPMNIFGDNWENHETRLKENWLRTVKEDDTVILAGDFSWAMNLEEAKPDFEFINALPGKKIMLKGNHDYWWTTITKMREYVEENEFKNIDFLFNNSFQIEDLIITGTRGWALNEKQVNEKVLNRELGRLELSLNNALSNYGTDKEIVVFMHYPPIINKILNESDLKFVELMKKYNVKRCYYAHLHGKSHQDALEGNIKGIEFKLVSGDYIDFKLVKI